MSWIGSGGGTASRCLRLDGGELARQAVGTERIQKLELGPAGGVGAAVGEVDDLALMDSVDRLVRLLDEALQALRQPVIAARRAARIVHALLDDGPVAVVGDDEAVQVEVEAVLDGGAVDLRHQAARVGERGAVKSDPLADRLRARAASFANACRGRRRHGCPSSPDSGSRPRFSAPITLVVMPEECQSMPMTAPNDWNQNGCARRRSNSSRP